MEEFVKREGSREGRLPVPEDKRQAVEGAAEHCDRKSKGKQKILFPLRYPLRLFLMTGYLISFSP